MRTNYWKQQRFNARFSIILGLALILLNTWFQVTLISQIGTGVLTAGIVLYGPARRGLNQALAHDELSRSVIGLALKVRALRDK